MQLSRSRILHGVLKQIARRRLMSTLARRTVLAVEYTLYNSYNCSMPFGRFRFGCRFAVRGGNVRQDAAHSLIADDGEIGERKKKRLADTKRSQALRISDARLFCHWFSFGSHATTPPGQPH